ncbi:peptide-methionine (R)-S-oxide reductase [Methanohalophilus sp. RSK]|uniref:peptide-methionine (R)-S-oxide reductase MsrB n=1 Tax=Methanohalophilus sp. RSK TaxID=2485783 RepID=UPI000F43BA20|nr:peptide-methionine (R)-S-oxide reductase MsrB [Methanohalophilus sp. RSK]RNI12976.1 peptide-methionine (R)-S-oxide reductase [Methanohalophilus sp. RSK]
MSENWNQISEEEWKKRLSAEQFRILRKKGTEAPFSGKYNDFYEKGIYSCAGCGQELFSSSTKYDTGTGWPSFQEAVSEDNIERIPDYSPGMKRIEVICSRCGGHLGHVFDDGPAPTGEHFCIDSISLNFNSE